MIELRKVIRNLATKKATGPDGIPAEVYRNMQALVAPHTDPLHGHHAQRKPLAGAAHAVYRAIGQRGQGTYIMPQQETNLSDLHRG